MHIAFVTEHVATFATNIKFNEGIYLFFAQSTCFRVKSNMLFDMNSYYIFYYGKWVTKNGSNKQLIPRRVVFCCIVSRNAVILPCGIIL